MLEKGAKGKVTKFADGTELLRIIKIYTNSEKMQACVLLLNVDNKAADKIYPWEKNNAINGQIIIRSKLVIDVWQGEFERIVF